MTAEQATCQNCKTGFSIGPDDLDFYKKIEVPPPTWCPPCRLQRRLTWRNERTLYKRACGLCGKAVIAVFNPQKPFPIYCSECYHGDGWDPLAYGLDVDFSRPFLEQFRELQAKVPRQYALVFQNVNSEYTNGAGYNKNCYLIFVSDHNEDCQYLYNSYHCKNSFDLSNAFNCEYSYESQNCIACSNTRYSLDCRDSFNLYASKDCVNCHDLVGCVGLRNKQYCIFNEQYDKEGYEAKLKELKLDSHSGVAALREKAAELFKIYPVKYMHGTNNTNVTGDNISNSKETFNSYFARNYEDCRNLINGDGARDCQDGYVATDRSELDYEFIGCFGTRRVVGCHIPWSSSDCSYTDACEASSDLFGCVGLRQKSYCILNKQYSKEEYEELAAKLKKHMNDMPYRDSQGRLYRFGDFFPPEISPYDYNETVNMEYFPLTADEAAAKGFSWHEKEKPAYDVTVAAEELPDPIAGTDGSVLKEVLGCAHSGQCRHQCTVAFKLTSAEFDFYKSRNIPLPRLCHNCRYYERQALLNPKTLHRRSCQCAGAASENGDYKNTSNNHQPHAAGEHCPNEFETTYAPDRPEIVYCEECYNAEVV